MIISLLFIIHLFLTHFTYDLTSKSLHINHPIQKLTTIRSECQSEEIQPGAGKERECAWYKLYKFSILNVLKKLLGEKVNLQFKII